MKKRIIITLKINGITINTISGIARIQKIGSLIYFFNKSEHIGNMPYSSFQNNLKFDFENDDNCIFYDLILPNL